MARFVPKESLYLSPSRIDELLAYLLADWEQLSEVEAKWEADEVVEMLVEWGVLDTHFDHLQLAADRGDMTTDQLDRLSRLKVVMEQNRPILERLRRR